MNYYNEFDPCAAEWLRNLIKMKLIPKGYVDERSITEVETSDLEGFTQCHFFAGVAGWPEALKIAGWPEDRPVWTGSPPCQPFSMAGKKLGFTDPRHLAPKFLDLIAVCRPSAVFGEQVAAAIPTGWLDFVQCEFQAEGYAFGSAILPAGGLGAPHKRDRLFFAADRGLSAVEYQFRHGKPGDSANANGQRLERCGTENDSGRWQGPDLRQTRLFCRAGIDDHHTGWENAHWLRCRDQKFRAVEPESFPLVDGLSGGVVPGKSELCRLARSNQKARLKGYGNAIVPQVAAEFIKATGIL